MLQNFVKKGVEQESIATRSCNDNVTYNNSTHGSINLTATDEQDCYIAQYSPATKAVAGNLPVAPMVPEDKIALVKATCCKNCTDDEFAMFVELSNRYRLDPFTHQIWCIKYDKTKPAQIFCGRDGFIAIAHRSGKFDGIESHGTYNEEDKLVSATATVWRKDCSHPFTVTVRAKEYNKHSGTWCTQPETMLCKVAECQCLRRAFPVSGLYDPTEMPDNMVFDYADPNKPKVEKPAIVQNLGGYDEPLF